MVESSRLHWGELGGEAMYVQFVWLLLIGLVSCYLGYTWGRKTGFLDGYLSAWNRDPLSEKKYARFLGSVRDLEDRPDYYGIPSRDVGRLRERSVSEREG